jgi:hypothetical protein
MQEKVGMIFNNTEMCCFTSVFNEHFLEVHSNQKVEQFIFLHLNQIPVNFTIKGHIFHWKTRNLYLNYMFKKISQLTVIRT